MSLERTFHSGTLVRSGATNRLTNPRSRRRRRPREREQAVAPVGSAEGALTGERGGTDNALSHPRYLRFWLGALVSNCGTWMQNVSVPFVIYQTTRSAALVGLTGFLLFVPGVLFGPVAGWLADRYPRRLVLLATQTAQGLVALLLWAVYSSGVRSVGVILALVFAGGVIQGLAIPAWQALVYELVPKEALPSAVTLNSAQFNGGRAIGPALGGAVLARYGASWAFLINAISFVAILCALLSIRPLQPWVTGPRRRASEQMRQSLQAVLDSRGLVVSMGVFWAMGALGHSLLPLMPVFATDVFRAGPGTYGLMLASLGTGGVLGAVLLTRRSSNEHRGRRVGRAMVVYAFALACFGVAPVAAAAIAALLVAGAAYLTVSASLTTSMQLLAPVHLRGGVIAINVMGFNLAFPIGSLGLGALIGVVNPRLVVLALASIIGTGALVLRRFGVLDAVAEDEDGFDTTEVGVTVPEQP